MPHAMFYALICILACLYVQIYMFSCFMPCFLCLDLFFPMFLMLDPHASMSHTMCLCLDLSFPCVVWIDPHVSMLVYMFIFLSYMLYALCRVQNLHAHMLDIMSMVTPCLDLHVGMHVLCSYAYVYAFTCLYAWVCILPCLYVISTCLDVYPHAYCAFPCLYVQIGVFTCLD